MNDRDEAATIQVLDAATIDKIAAGEVIERPASVVKELVENSLDAGARTILVELRGAPGDLIRVSDDGRGMSARDAAMAFLRHATSKIRTATDLESVLTLGFRGEALASIGAVTRAELVTRRAQDRTGTRVTCVGGVIEQEGDAPSPVGTTVTCRDLFFNTPARRKFMRSPSTEFGHVCDAVARLALAQPGVRIRLVHDGRETLAVPAGCDRRAAIAATHGARLARVLLPIAAGSDRTRIEGFVSAPDTTRPGRDAQLVFVNGRPVVAGPLAHAIERAYGTRLPAGRHPVLFIWVETDPRSIDVNVHPAKREIRFPADHEVFKLVVQAVSSALHSLGASPDLGRALGGPADAAARSALADGTPVVPRAPAPLWGAQEARSSPSRTGEARAAYGDASGARGASTPAASTGAPGGPPDEFEPLGSFLDAYILARNGRDLVIIDQHAAHERVLYEALLDALRSEESAFQAVLPTPLELGPAIAARLGGRLGELARLGIVIEEFGASTFLLRGVPVALARSRLSGPAAAEAIVVAIEEFARESPRAERGARAGLERLAASLACKAAVKAGDALGREEIARLISDLGNASDPYSCPHGRPTILRLSLEELERAFGRR